MNKELYNSYLSTKARVQLLQTQIESLSQDLYNSENELLSLEQQIRASSEDALLQTLL